MIKLIHPKTGVVREIPESYQLKLDLLKRAGFILFENYRAPKKPVIVADPTVADEVEKRKQEAVDPEGADKPVTAIHASGAARGLIKKHDLDPALIEGTGKDGQITKPDVKKFLEALEAQSEAVAAIAPPAEEVLTHDDIPGTGDIEELFGEEDAETPEVVQEEVGEEEAE